MNSRAERRPTLRTIAERTGLAVATVSRALSDAPDIGSETKKRVRAIAKEVGYVPSRVGRGLRTGRTHVICVPVSPEQSALEMSLVSAIALALIGTPYQVNLVPYMGRDDWMDPVRETVETGSADAVALSHIEPNDERVAYLLDRNFPLVTFGRSSWHEKHAYFEYDNAVFGRDAVAGLVGLGRRDITLLGYRRELQSRHDMLAGAQSEAVRLGARFTLLECVEATQASCALQAAIVDHLEKAPQTDAFICPSSKVAMDTIVAAESVGRVLGQDFDVFSKEGVPMLQLFRKGILTALEDPSQIGTFLAKAAIHAIEKPDDAPLTESVVAQLRVAGS